MQYNELFHKASKNKIWSLLIIIMVILTLLVLRDIQQMEGNSRVVNYAGRVRGDAQQLAKQELTGHPNDDLILQLDNLIQELQTGTGPHHLHYLPDEEYRQRLQELSGHWLELKKAIHDTRDNLAYAPELYARSEIYVKTADAMVQAADNYADGLVARLRVVELLLVLDILFLLAWAAFQVGKFIQMSQKNSTLAIMAYRDPGTGLCNRRRCEERLSNPDPIPENISIVCFMFDLNNLKIVNDTIGHKAGDKLIAAFAEALKATIVPHMFTGRLGGDEFIAIGTRMSLPEAQTFLQQLQSNVLAENRKHPQLTLSYASGYALSTDYPGYTIRELMDAADQKMYQNKQAMKKHMAETKSLNPTADT